MVVSMFVLAALTALAPAAPGEGRAAAQEPETVLVVEFEVKDQGVNAADDAEIASVAREATRLFRERVEADARFALVEEGDGSGGPAAGSGTRGSRCRTDACTRQVARAAGATRVIRGRYVKLSNLIRYLAVELVDPSSGRVLRSAAAELKGQRDAILERAVANLYEHLHPPSAGRAAGAGE